MFVFFLTKIHESYGGRKVYRAEGVTFGGCGGQNGAPQNALRRHGHLQRAGGLAGPNRDPERPAEHVAVGGAAGGRAGDTAAAAPETSLPLLEPSLPPMPAEAKKSSTSASATLSDAILCRTAPSGSPALSIDRYFRNAGRR